MPLLQHPELDPTKYSIEQLQGHLTKLMAEPDSIHYPENPVGNSMALSFRDEFRKNAANHPAKLDSVPVIDSFVLHLVEETVSADQRSKYVPPGQSYPIILSGIDPNSQERTAMAMLITARVEEEGEETIKPVGIRNLLLMSQEDIQNSFALEYDEEGIIHKLPYSDLIPSNARALLRGWTFIFPEINGMKLTGLKGDDNLSDALGKATRAAALTLKESVPYLSVIGEQLGLMPESIVKALIQYAEDGSVNIDNVAFPLYQILGYNDVKSAQDGLKQIRAQETKSSPLTSFEIRRGKSTKQKLELAGVDPNQNFKKEDLLREIPIKPYFGTGNINAQKMPGDAQRMGAKVRPRTMSAFSIVPLGGGAVYSGQVV